MMLIYNYSVSHKSHWMCADNVDMERNEKMKTILNEYFDKQSLDDEVEEEEEDDDPVSLCVKGFAQTAIQFQAIVVTSL